MEVNTIDEVSKVLETYDLSEIFEMNELTDEDVLLFLVKQEFVTLPEILPVDFYD